MFNFNHGLMDKSALRQQYAGGHAPPVSSFYHPAPAAPKPPTGEWMNQGQVATPGGGTGTSIPQAPMTGGLPQTIGGPNNASFKPTGGNPWAQNSAMSHFSQQTPGGPLVQQGMTYNPQNTGIAHSTPTGLPPLPPGADPATYRGTDQNIYMAGQNAQEVANQAAGMGSGMAPTGANPSWYTPGYQYGPGSDEALGFQIASSGMPSGAQQAQAGLQNLGLRQYL